MAIRAGRRHRVRVVVTGIGMAAIWAAASVTVSSPATASVAAGPRAPAAAVSDPTQTNYSLGALVLKYFPLTADGQNIDINVTGDVGDPVDTIRAKTDSITANLETFLAKGSTYHGYADPTATPSLTYHVVDTKEFDVKVPTVSNPFYGNGDPYKSRPDYNKIMSGVDICDYVQNKGVNEVWIFAYQGPSQLQIDESKMAGPEGDYSNSWVHNEMPVCQKTYTVYTFNYQRGTAEAVHSHGHQLEAELNYVDSNTFTNLFEGLAHPGGTSATSRCGSVHNPPNSTADYDYADTAPQASDCLSWFPDGTGPAGQISCQSWGCADVSDSDNAQLNYLVWWMQNFPGKGNQVTLAGRHMRNWWDVHADFDQVATGAKSLTVASYPCTADTCDNLLDSASVDAASGAGCSSGASSISGTKISADGGTLDLSQGPNCSVKFARFVPKSNGTTYYIWVDREDPAFNAVGRQFTGASGTKYYSNQVYAPGLAQACVREWTGSAWKNPVCTKWA